MAGGLAGLAFKARVATAAVSSMSTVASEAADAQATYLSSLQATIAEQRNFAASAVEIQSASGTFLAGGVSTPLDVVDLIKSYVEIAKAIRSMGASARDISEGKIALGRLEDLIRRFGNPDFVAGLDWQEMRGYGSSRRRARKTSRSTSTGTTTTSLSTAAAQGKMGW